MLQLVGGEELGTYLREVGDRVKADADKRVERLGTQTKKKIKSCLSPSSKWEARPYQHVSKTGGGIRSGVYYRSMKTENMNKGKNKELGKIHFKVGATAPHYRLAHLLENGHHLVYYGRKTNLWTKSIPHMSVGQKYADDNVVKVFEKAIHDSFEKG